ncbi:MAG: DUF2341 domain-containing protein [archaeon]
MNKKAVVKASILAVLLVAAVLFLLMVPSSSSAIVLEKSEYELGETVSLDLSSFHVYRVKITTPSKSYVKEGNDDSLAFKPEEVGSYSLRIQSGGDEEYYSFEVVGEDDEGTFEEDGNATDEEDTSGDRIVVGRPVKWKENFEIASGTKRTKLSIPESENVSVFRNIRGQKEKVNFTISRDFSSKGKMSLVFQNVEGNLEVEYYTPGAEKQEVIFSEREKEVKISSPPDMHYQNVLSYTNVSELTSRKDAIKVYWKEAGRYVDFEALDEDGNGLLDYVEWVVPHLSDQTFYVYIFIESAEHLDENRVFVEDVFEEVKELDDVWKEIPSDHYVRVRFEQNLTRVNDIKIYARSSDNAIVEVYGAGGVEKIADFGVIVDEGWYRIILEDLQIEQDLFDLKVVGGSVEFDYIVDPTILVDTDYGRDVALATLDDTTFVVAWIDYAEGDISFRVYDTDGTALTDVVDVANEAEADSQISVQAYNSTDFILAWIDYGDSSGGGTSEDVEAAWYNREGVNTVAQFNVDTDVGNTNALLVADVSVAVHSDRYYICHIDDEDNDADAAAFLFSNPSTQVGGDIQIDGGAGPAGVTPRNIMECSAINDTHWVAGWYDDGTGGCNSGGNDIMTSVRLQDGTAVTSCAVSDDDVGTAGDGMVATTSLNGDRFVVLWTDNSGADDLDLEMQILDAGGNTILGATIVDPNHGGLDARPGLATVTNVSDPSQDYFIAAWNDRNSEDIRGILYDSAGAQKAGPFVLASDESATEFEFDIYGKDAYTGIGLCPGTFVFAYTNVSENLVVKTFNIDGTDWDGICDFDSPGVEIISPESKAYGPFDFPIFFNVTLDEFGDAVLYSLDGGASNVSMSSLDNLSYNASVSSLVGGAYVFRVYANDTKGNRNLTESVSFTVDFTGPTITVDSPQETNYTVNNIDLNFSIPDLDVDSCWYSTEGGDPNISIPYCENVSVGFAQGDVTLVVYANDSLSNEGASSPVSYFVDSLFPLVNFEPPTALHGSSRNQNYIEVNVSVVEENLINITYTLGNGSGILNITTFDTLVTELVWENLGNQDIEYSYNVTVVDVLGNPNSTETRAIILTNVDTAAPDIYFIMPESEGYYYNSSSVDFEVTMSENASFVYYNLNDSFVNHTMSTENNITYNATNTSIADGHYEIVVYANDTLDNAGSRGRNFSVDTVFPLIDFGQGLEEDGVNLSRDWIYVNVSVVDLNVWVVNFTLYDSVSLVNFNESYDDAREVNWTELLDGDYVYNVTVIDKAMHLNETSSLRLRIDQAAPSADLLSPGDGLLLDNRLQNFSVGVGDNLGLFNATFFVYNSTGLLVYNETISYFGISSVIGIVYEAPYDGGFNWSYLVVDSAGNENLTVNYTFLVDSTPPLINFTFPTEPNEVSVPRSWIYANVSVVEDNFANITFELSNDTDLIDRSFFDYELYSINWTDLSSNGVAYYYNVTVFDSLGFQNRTETRTIHLIDGSAPAITVFSPENSTYEYSRSIRVDYSISEEYLDSCWYVLDGGANVNLPGCGPGFFETSDGPHTLELFARDASFNVNSTNVTFYVNTSLVETSDWFVQRGQESGVNGVLDVPLSDPVDRSKSFVLVTTRDSDSGPDTLQVTGTLTNTTNLRLENYNSGGGAQVSWEIITGPSLRVQRGEKYSVVGNGTLTDYIGEVNLSSAFAFTTSRSSSTTGVNIEEGYWEVSFADNSTLDLTRRLYDSEGYVSWQVVEWEGAGVQSGSFSTAGTTASGVLSPEVNLSKSLLIFSWAVSAGGMNDVSLWGELISNSSVDFYRQGADGTLSATWFVVEGNSLNVQKGTSVLSNISTPQYETLSRKLGFLNQSFNRASWHSNGGDTVSRTFLTTTLVNETVLALQKDSTGSISNNISWQVVELVNIPPGVSLVSPVNNSNLSSWVVGPFNFTVIDDNGLANCSLYGGWGGGWHLDQTILSPGSGAGNFSSADVGVDGTYEWNVECFDSKGVWGTASVNNTFLVDTVWPLVEFGEGTEESGVNRSRNWIYVNVSIIEANEINVTFTLWNLTSEVNVTTLGAGNRTFNWTGLSDEVYSYNVSVIDIVGHENSTETRVIALDVTAPDGSLVSPTDENYTNEVTQNLTVSATDNLGLNNLTLYVYNSTGDLIYNETASVSGAEAVIGLVYTFLTEGVFTWFYGIFDMAGNWFVTDNRTVIVDLTNPGIEFGSGVDVGGANRSRDWIYVNVTVNDSYEGAVTFWLFNETSEVGRQTYPAAIPAGVNLLNNSLGTFEAVTTTSSSTPANWGPAKLVDNHYMGDSGYAWASGSGNNANQNVTVNFTSEYVFNTIEIFEGYGTTYDASPKNMRVYVSDDFQNWELVASKQLFGSVPTFIGQHDAVEFYDQTKRYVRVEFVDNWGNPSFLGCNEIRIYKASENLANTSNYVVDEPAQSAPALNVSLTRDGELGGAVSYWEADSVANVNVTWDFGMSRRVNLLEWYGSSSGSNLYPQDYVVLVSDDDVTYTEVSSGSFVGGSYGFVEYINWTEQTSQYLRLSLLDAHGSSIRANEIRVWESESAARYDHNFTDLEDGFYYYNVTVRDLADNVNRTSTLTINLDTTSPLIDYGSETLDDGINVSQNFVYVNISLVERNLDNLTYFLFNETDELNRTTYFSEIYEINWTNLSLGTYFYNVTAYDLSFHSNSTETREITLDYAAPNGTLVLPLNGTMTANLTQNFTVNVTDNLGLSNLNLYIYNATNDLVYNETVSVSGTEALIGLVYDFVADGIYTWFYSVYDTVGNWFVTGNNTITIDTIGPEIVVNGPIGVVKDVTPLLNVTLDELVDTLWYNVGGGQNMTLCMNCGDEQKAFLYLKEGDFVFNVYANDSAGNVGSNSSSFVVNMSFNYFDSFEDNSSIVQYNGVVWNTGNVSFTGAVAWNMSYVAGSPQVNGSWKGIYGSSGVILDGWAGGSGTSWDMTDDVRNLSKISSYSFTGNVHTWSSSTAELRAVENITGTTRRATCSYAPSGALTFRLNTTIENYNLTFYILDWDTTARRENITVQSLDGSFSANHYANYNLNGGAYITFEVRGINSTVTTIVPLAGANAVVSGVFVDEIPAGGNGNFVSYPINTTQNIVRISNVSWNEAGTDEGNNVGVQLSVDGGANWYNITKHFGVNVSRNNSLVYRVLFNTNSSKTISLLDMNISWEADLIAPNGGLISPQNGSYSNNVTQNFTVNVTDNYELSNLTLFIYNSTNDLVYNETVSVSGTEALIGLVYDFVVDGIYTWFYQIYDAVGNWFITGNSTITIDTTKPGIYFGEGVEDSGANRSRNWVYVNVSVVEINEANISFDLYNESGFVTETFSSSGQRVVNWTSLLDGIYYYNVTVVDKAGLSNSTETREITLDVTPPVIVIESPHAGAYGYNESIGLNYSVSDNLIGLDSCWWNLDNEANNSIDCGENTAFDTNESVHTLYFYSNDSLNNLQMESVSFAVVLSAPAVTLLAPADRLVFNYTQDINFSYLPVDSDGIDTCGLYGNWSGWHLNQTDDSVVNDSISSFYVNLSDENWYDWNVLCNDTLGLEAFSFTNYSFAIDLTYPSVLFGDGTDESGANLSRSSIYVNVTVLEANEANVTFGLWNSSSVVNVTTLGAGNRTFNWTGLNDGNYYYNISVIDLAGQRNFSETRKITLDVNYPLIDYGIGTAVNGANVSQSNVYVNVSVIEVNEQNITFGLWNLTDELNVTTLPAGARTINWTGLGDDLYSYNVTVEDLAGNKNWTETREINLDTNSPSVFLEFPADRIGDNDGNITFGYNVSVDEVANCSLIVNGKVNQTNSTVLGGDSYNFSLFELSAAGYYWDVNCTDFAGNTGNSSTRVIDVILTGGFSGDTTDFSQVDTENITGLTLDSPGLAKIVYNEAVNLSGGADLASLVVLGYNLSGVDSSSEGRLNRSATIYLYSLTYQVAPLVLKDGGFCQGGVCVINYYEGGNLSFNVTGFTNYSATENSVLRIWDDTDTMIVYEFNAVDFFANYTNKTSGLPINETGAFCNISFNVTGDWETWKEMGFNASSLLYEYNSSFVDNGTYSWKVFCNVSSSEFEPFLVYDEFNITADVVFPLIQFGDGTLESGVNVSQNWVYANVSVTEDNEANITFGLFNSTHGGVNITTFYTAVRMINWTGLEDGTYYYNVSVVDWKNNVNLTETRTITLDVTAPNATLVSPGNDTITANATQNFTVNATDTIGLQNLTLYIYNSTNDLVYNESVSVSGTEALIGIVYEFIVDGVFTWFYGVFDIAGNWFVTGNNTITIDTIGPVVDLVAPGNGSVVSNSTIWFASNFSDVNDLANATLFVWNSTDDLINQTFREISGTANFTNVSVVLPVLDSYHWNYFACDNVSNCNWNATNWSLDYEVPQVGLEKVSPVGNFVVLKNHFFSVVLNVSCLVGSCGEVNVSLDPEGYVIEVFNESGNFTVPEGVTKVDVLVVAGGGAAGSHVTQAGTSTGSGGGGAGGLAFQGNYSVTPGETLNVTVGAGGISPATFGQGGNGLNSSFGNLTAVGGGGGGYRNGGGRNGGSGGGAGYSSAGGIGTAGQGYNGGTGTSDYGGSGGGGASQAGENGNGDNGRPGGNGTNFTSVFGAGYGDGGFFAGGGGGGGRTGVSYTGGPGGFGGGGDGGRDSNGESGMNGTGGGGGGSGNTGYRGGNGGSGIVIIKYKYEKLGLVPVGSGAPFYTNESNPRNISLGSGESELMTFWVNATGAPDSYEFFAFANLTSDMGVANVSDYWNVTIELPSPPGLIIVSPLAQNYNVSQAIDFNVSGDETLSFCLFSFDDYATNFSMTRYNLTYYNYTNSSMVDGIYSARFWCNDSLGSANDTEIVDFVVDFTGPNGTLVSPGNGTYQSNATQNFTVNATDAAGLSNLTLFIYNSTNDLVYNETVSVSGTEALIGVVYEFIVDGIYTWFYEIFDLVGRTFATENRTLIIDTTYSLVNFGEGSEVDGGNVSRSDVYVNVTVDEINEANVTFRVFNSSGWTNVTTLAAGMRTINWTGLGDGLYSYNVTVEDLAGNRNSTETRTIRLDTTSPVVRVLYPQNGTYSENVTVLNYTASDPLLDSCWYSLNDGAENTSVDCGDNITGLNVGNGQYNWTVYANDSFGQESFSRVMFDVNVDIPTVVIVYPTSVTYPYIVTELNYTVFDDELDSCWYGLDGGPNQSITCGDNVTGLSANEGSNTWAVFANDSGNLVGWDEVTFSVDTTPPGLVIESPENRSYYPEAIDFNITGSENLDTCLVSLDGWVTNYSMSEFNSTYFNYTNSSMTLGGKIARFWCNDSVGNVNGTESVGFGVNFPVLGLEVVYPTEDVNVSYGDFFSVIMNVSCSVTDCGDVNVSLDPSVGWWDYEWGYRKEVNITNVGSTNLTNFPAYLNISKEIEMQSDYGDLRFVNGSCESGQSLELDYEIANYTGVTAEAWIKVPVLSNSSPTTVCMYYGNSDAENGENVSGVWSNGLCNGSPYG